MFWKRTTPAAALTVILCGIPCGMLMDWYILERQPLEVGGVTLIRKSYRQVLLRPGTRKTSLSARH
jgi:hypothetical protein